MHNKWNSDKWNLQMNLSKMKLLFKEAMLDMHFFFSESWHENPCTNNITCPQKLRLAGQHNKQQAILPITGEMAAQPKRCL